MSIPATKVQDTAARVRSGEPANSLSVLVVDDLSDVRDALSDVTRRLGHACRAVGTAAALATEIREGGGLNFASMLILISAAENQAAGQVWPFDGFVQKPINGPALGRLIGWRTPH